MKSDEEKVLFEGVGVIERLTAPSPYKSLISGAVFEDYEGRDSGVFAQGINVLYPVSEEELIIDEEQRTIRFDYYENSYLIRPLTEEDNSWVNQNSLKEIKEALDGTITFW
jgi:hypothetical protein